MEHIKNYWWLYLILIAAAIYGIMVYRKYRANRLGQNNQDNSPQPVNGKCPSGYEFIQPQCITTPCNGYCSPI